MTAIAPANIAFIKYWGKADPPAGEAGETLRFPLNSSISMNLSACVTTTTVEFSKKFSRDDVIFLETLTTITRPRYVCQRVTQHLDLLRERSGTKFYAKVVTSNTFPSAAGIASSASGFAALTVAGAAALGMNLSGKELSILARLGSGSACRSIPDGFVEWKKGKDSDTSYAYSLYPSTYWDIRDVLVIVDYRMKKVSTTEGQTGVKTSPFWQDRVDGIPKKMIATKAALKEKNFRVLGEIIEEDCLNMHHVMQTQRPPVFYWNDVTKIIMDAVVGWRRQGLAVYFTIDAGPNVHLICEGKDEREVTRRVRTMQGVEQVMVNKPARGAHLITDHLF